MTAAGLPPGVLDELRRVAGDGAHCTADAASLPAAPGAYLLLMTIAHPLSLRIRTLSPVVLPPGWYVYAGNARGRGGIRARVMRHLRPGKSPHWHVDRLTEAAEAILAIAFAGGHECALVQALLARPRFQADVPGFGGTDCRVCPAHLLTVRLGPEFS
jgi:Uri superfamily endonuclease